MTELKETSPLILGINSGNLELEDTEVKYFKIKKQEFINGILLGTFLGTPCCWAVGRTLCSMANISISNLVLSILLSIIVGFVIIAVVASLYFLLYRYLINTV